MNPFDTNRKTQSDRLLGRQVPAYRLDLARRRPLLLRGALLLGLSRRRFIAFFVIHSLASVMIGENLLNEAAP
jgi:hypothetical protein